MMKKKVLLFMLLSICFVFGLKCNVNAEEYAGDGYTLTYSVADNAISITGCTTTKSAVDVLIPEKINNISVTKIASEAFDNCTSVTTINVPDSVTSFGSYAFRGCSALKSVNIPNGVTYIARYAFSSCSELTNINIPDSVTSIGECAFLNCSSLKKIYVPESVTSIEDYALGCVSKYPKKTLGGFIIYGVSGSQAAKYAKQNDITFISHVSHSFDSWEITQPATCIATGTQTRTCTVCGVKETQTIPVSEHQYGSWVVTQPATCTATGTQTRTCTVCGAKETQTIAATGHNYGSWLVTQPSTVFTAGVQTRTCTACGAAETAPVVKLKATIKLSKTKVTLKKKKSTTIKVSYGKGDSVKSWKSSNKKTATVTSKGKITAKKKGKATITVVLKSGKKATVKVTVK